MASRRNRSPSTRLGPWTPLWTSWEASRGSNGWEFGGSTAVRWRSGRGGSSAAHGALTVPAPATGLLLEGLEVGPNGPVTGEATTPTGAVLLRVLTEGPPPSRWRAAASGWGAGGRNPAGYPNVLRVMLADAVAEAGEVVVTATDLDDFSPEYLEPVRVELFAAGALDVQVWGTMAKKGRAGLRIEVVSEAGRGRRGGGGAVPAHDHRRGPAVVGGRGTPCRATRSW